MCNFTSLFLSQRLPLTIVSAVTCDGGGSVTVDFQTWAVLSPDAVIQKERHDTKNTGLM